MDQNDFSISAPLGKTRELSLSSGAKIHAITVSFEVTGLTFHLSIKIHHDCTTSTMTYDIKILNAESVQMTPEILCYCFVYIIKSRILTLMLI